MTRGRHALRHPHQAAGRVRPDRRGTTHQHAYYTPTASQSRAKRPKTNSTPVVLVGEVGKQSLVRERLLLAELRQVGDVRKLKV